MTKVLEKEDLAARLGRTGGDGPDDHWIQPSKIHSTGRSAVDGVRFLGATRPNGIQEQRNSSRCAITGQRQLGGGR